MRAIDVMVRDVVTVHPATDVAEAIRLLADRIVHLWGLVGSKAERKALLALAESVPGVSRVADEMIPPY
jgi:osmotically-inducible protein OsmY